MPKSDSLIVKITLLFIFSSISFIFFALYFISAKVNKNNAAIEQRYDSVIENINDLLKFGYDIGGVQTYLSDIGFYQVSDFSITTKVSRRYLMSYYDIKFIVNVRKIDGHYYIIIEDTKNDMQFIYTDYDNGEDYTTYHAVALLSFITLIFFYILVLRSIIPLSLLRREVKKFANGNMDIKVISNNKDEIGELSREFAKAANTINEMNKARVLFLRSIMHELKTPIAKGRIVTEMLEDKKAKDRLISVFTRLNVTIDNFAKIEEINTHNYKTTKTRFRLIDLIDNINKMLLIEEERPRNVILMSREAEMFADFDAMCLSVKNLLDNALKYSDDHRVIVFVDGGDLVVQNQGKPFKNDLHKYFSPFYSDGSDNKQKGLGLGMYIIKNTIEAQGLVLDYKYIEGNHYFYIKDCIIENTYKKEIIQKRDIDG